MRYVWFPSCLAMISVWAGPTMAAVEAVPLRPAQIEEEDEDAKEEDKSFELETAAPKESRRFKDVFGSSASAGESKKVATTPKQESAAVRPPWSGSSVHWGNVARMVNLQRDALLTYNPYTAMSLSLRPTYRLPYVQLSADFRLSTQLTQADDGQTSSLADPSLSVRPQSSYEVPGTGVKLSGSGSLALGLSPYSQAVGQAFSATARGSMVRALEVAGVKGSVRLGLGWTGYLTATQQGTTARAVGPACVQGLSAFVEMPDDCAGIFIHDGSPTNRYKTSMSLGANVKALPWLSLSLGGGLSATEVYPMVVDDERISYRRVEAPVTTRYFQAFSLGAALGPWSGFGASLGYATASPQLRPDAESYGYLYNRFTMLSLEFSYQL